jgi:hypothetical protein
MELAKGISRGFKTIMDHPIGDVEDSYDRVAAEYARRIFGSAAPLRCINARGHPETR